MAACFLHFVGLPWLSLHGCMFLAHGHCVSLFPAWSMVGACLILALHVFFVHRKET